MGFYINPKDGSEKEAWLGRHNRGIMSAAPDTHVRGDDVLVCLVDNGAFTAAGICFDDAERQAFARPDGRDKLWLWVPKADVAEFMHGQEIKP